MKKIVSLIFLLGVQFAFSQTLPKEDSKDQTAATSTSNTLSETDIPAEFPGGMIALRRHISSKFDTSKLSGSGIFKSVTKFLIHPDGSMDSILTTGNNPPMNKEMTRIIKEMKIKWKPATRNGLPIETWYQIPTTINI